MALLLIVHSSAVAADNSLRARWALGSDKKLECRLTILDAKPYRAWIRSTQAEIFGRRKMKPETETKRAELYVSECCVFEVTITNNQISTRCLINISTRAARSGQRIGRFRRILQRFFRSLSVCRCECHHSIPV